MAKINDLTTFPNTLPAPSDHVIGTDISDTGTDANGEVVTFTLSDIGRVAENHAGWHYYDAVYLGDGADGLIYDFSVDGAVASVAFSSLEDGYDYGFKLNEISGSADSIFRVVCAFSSGSNATFNIADLSGVGQNSRDVSGIVYFPNTRVLQRYHLPEFSTPIIGDNAADFSDSPSAVLSGTPRKITSMTFSFASGNLDNGTLSIIRRRNGLS